jgi:lysophospholipid hydrolase
MSSSLANATLVAASVMAAPSPPPPGTSTFGLLGWVILSILKVVPGALLWVIALATITIPTWMYTVLSYSLTVTVNFSTMAFIVVGILSTISYLIRYRYHTYARLPAEPPRKEPEVEIFPDPQGDKTKPGLSNFLDEFMSAIKVFGYLDRHVFHELTRTMHTRKLVAGETLSLDEEKGFCMVVEGNVQVFVHSGRDEPEDRYGESEDEENFGEAQHQGYQLLSEVKNGAPLSSLFSILSLFSEDVKLRHTREPTSYFGDQTPDPSRPVSSHVGETVASPENSAVLDSPIRLPNGRHHRSVSNITTPTTTGRLPRVPPLSLDVHTPEAKHTQPGGNTSRNDSRRSSHQASAHPDIVARAAEDSTIAIIPAIAFRRLTRMYPKATAQIVQVILSRFYRVTLATGHQYLSLTHEILKTERAIDKFAHCDLPGFLRDAPLERLKEKFEQEKERTKPEERLKGIALHNPGAGRRRRSSSTLRREATLQVRIAESRSKRLSSPDSSRTPEPLVSPDAERAGVSAGDLLAGGASHRASFSQPLQTPAAVRRAGARSPLDKGYFSPRPMQLERQNSIDEDDLFRETILQSICNAIGLNKENTIPAPTPTVEQSPRMVSFDSRRNKAFFNNAFQMLSTTDASADGDSASIVSESVSGVGVNNSANIIEDMVNEVEIVYFQKGSVLVEQEERLPGLYYVIDGFLEVSMTTEEDGQQANILGTAATSVSFDTLTGANGKSSNIPRRPSANVRSRSRANVNKKRHRHTLTLVKPGAIAGYLPAVSSYRSFVDITAKSDVVVGFLPRASLDRLVDRFPIILLTLAKRLTAVLDRTILHIDFALEYLQVSAGQVIYDQGDQSDSIFIILNGRLRAIQEKEDKTLNVLGEYGQGDSVGELEVLTETTRPGSLHAIRDTELAKVPKMLFNSLAQEHPGITMKMSRILAKRMRVLMESPQHMHSDKSPTNFVTGNPSSTSNLRTVCVLPINSGAPVVEFASRLTNALTQIGTSVTSLNQGAILNHLGRHAFTKMGKLKLSQYLADLEEKYGIVLYVADTNVQSPWTQTCITQSDCILLVGVAAGSPAVGEYERLLLTTKTTARRELILIHDERLCPPGLTRKWLRNREWINGGHHHVQMTYKAAPEPIHPPSGRRFGSVIKQRVQIIQAEIQKYTSRRVRQTPLYSAETPFKGDFHRLARRLCGKSVGLVLGGGGARGIAHVGVIRALEEAGIPIDMVGGTSIGAFVGALYAWDAGIVPMYGRTKRFAGRMGSMWRFALDLTYPS